MESLSATMRRYLTLFEAEMLDVEVTIKRYNAVADDQLGSPPFPQCLSVKIESELDREAASRAVKADVQASTGYEPAEITWRYADQSIDPDTGKRANTAARSDCGS